MKRLTRRCKQALNDKMTRFKKFIEIALSEPKYHEKGNFSTQSTYDIYETNRLYPMADKLASYEDAEEQGLLLRLPCKVGDTVYLVGTYRNSSIGEMGVEDILFRDDTVYIGLIDVTDSDYTETVYASDFGKTVFFTKEEAEKALVDMGV